MHSAIKLVHSQKFIGDAEKNNTDASKPGVTKHRNGTERNGIYRNEPEYTGTRRNDAGTKGNGQEWNRNVPERAGMTPKYTEMSRNETGMNTNMVG